jgi:hypothetical protein
MLNMPDLDANKVITIPKARRISRGRGHSYTLDGQPVMGVTTILGKALPKPALVPWAAREVAEFVAARREILTELSDPELIDLCKGAPGRTRDAAANRGTEVHRLADKLAHGQEVDVPEELAGHVDAYLAFLAAFKPSSALLERPVFNRKYRYGGTMDMLAESDDLGRTLFDIKTSGSGIYGDIALQLAAYGNSEVYVDEAGTEHPMPEVDSYAAIWVRADGYDVYPIDVTDRDFKTFLYVQQVAWWIDNRQQEVKGESIWRRQEVKA